MTAMTRHATNPATATTDWRASAACATVDPDLHFPIRHTNGWKKQTKAAKSVCAACPVRDACLEWALETRQPAGIWGGMSERERMVELGVRESQTERCMNLQPWIELQLAGGMSQRRVADRLGVTGATLSRCVARWQAERAAAGVGEVRAA